MKPKVSLINYTPDAIPLMCWARRVMHSPVPDSLEEFKRDPKKWLGMEMDEYVEKILMKDGMPTFLEYVSLTFKFENVSRALTHQLVRHRIGFSYSQQSLRCVDLPNFAENKNYTNPFLKDTSEYIDYHAKMLIIQSIYRKALECGVPTQDARGLLPINIQTTITFACSLRALIGMVNKRLCFKTQQEFNSVAQQIVKLIKTIDPRLAIWFKAPCEYSHCMMEAENEQQYQEGKLKDVQNTRHVCPRYIKFFKKEGETV